MHWIVKHHPKVGYLDYVIELFTWQSLRGERKREKKFDFPWLLKFPIKSCLFVFDRKLFLKTLTPKNEKGHIRWNHVYRWAKQNIAVVVLPSSLFPPSCQKFSPDLKFRETASPLFVVNFRPCVSQRHFHSHFFRRLHFLWQKKIRNFFRNCLERLKFRLSQFPC